MNPGKERSKAERRLARLEQLIDENDIKKAELEERMADPENASDYAKLQEMQEKLDELNAQADAYLEEWESLEEFLAENKS